MSQHEDINLTQNGSLDVKNAIEIQEPAPQDDTHGVLVSKELMRESVTAEGAERRQRAWDAIKTHPKAILWSLGVSLLVVSESFEQNLFGSLTGVPSFRREFGRYVQTSHNYQLTAAWQAALTNATAVGAIVGNIIAGPTVARIGYRRTGLIGLFGLASFVFLSFFATHVSMMFAGKLLSAMCWGLFITIGPGYSSEIAPLHLRGALTIWVEACFTIGSFLQVAIVYATQKRTDQWSWRLPLALQWIWPIPLATILIFAPESPWWLVRKGRLEEAARSVKRLGSTPGVSPHEAVSNMIRTIEIERQTSAGASYKDCFMRTDLRRTIICALCYISQHYGANNLDGAYFLEQAGFPTSQAFALSLGTQGLKLLACFLCMVASSYFGRRAIFIWGNIGTLALCLMMGVAACASPTPASEWVQGVASIALMVMYGLTIGPVTYALIAEVSSVRLRAHTLALAKAVSFASGIPVGYITTYSLNPSAWNLKGKSAFIWGSCTLVMSIAAYFGLPELKGRTYRELDILFQRRVPARKFSTTEIEEEMNE